MYRRLMLMLVLATALGACVPEAEQAAQDPSSPPTSTRLQALAPAAPVVVTPPNGSTTNDNTPIYSGTAEANVTVTVTVDGSNIGDVNADASGNWTLTPVAPLADGSHTVAATATNVSNETSPLSNTNTFIVDTTPPPAPVTITPANGSLTNDSTPTYTGTAEPGTTITVTVDGTPSGTTTADGSGNWSFTPVTPLAQGPHQARATAADDAGNTSVNSNTNTFTVDTIAPVAPVIVAPASSSTTNDNTPTYTGTAEANATVTVTVDGNSVGTATANGAGSWSLTPVTPLADGVHTARATATDAAGNTGPNSVANSFTIDTTPPPAPVVVTPANGSTTNDNTPTYSGTAEASATVTLIVDGNSVGTATANGAGSWSLTPVVPLADGVHTARATATDDAGNTSPDSNTNTFTIDTTPPPAPVVITPANGSLTNDNTPTYTGTAEPGTMITVTVDGASIGTTTADGSGNWSFTPVTPLAQGSHQARATATDEAGNTSVNSNTNTFTVDTTAPAAPVVVTPANGSTTNDNTPTYSGTAEASATVTVSVDGNSVGTTTANGAGSWSLTPVAPLADGSHTVRTTATDAAGNTSVNSNTNTFTVDTTAPAAPVVAAPANGSTTNDNTPTYSGTAEANATVTLIVDGTPVGTTTASGAGSWSLTPVTPLADGVHTARATAADAVGNTSVNSNTSSFTVDATAPAAPVITAPANNARVNDSTPTYTGTAEANATVTVIVDGSSVGTTTANNAGSWSFTQPTALSEAAHQVRASATDAAGNTSPQSPNRSFTVDVTAPTVTISAPAAGAALNVTAVTVLATVDDQAATVTASLDGAAAQAVTVGAGGALSLPLTALAQGSHTITFTATDAAGNSSTASRTFSVDTIAPTPTIAQPAANALLNDDTPTISGTGEAGSTLEVEVFNAQSALAYSATVTVAAGGAWSTTATTLPDGSYTILLTATDAAGNTAGTTPRQFTVDATAPTVTITQPANNAFTADTTPDLQGAAEAGSSVAVEIRSAANAVVFTATVTAGAQGWSTTSSALASGVYTARAVATDAAGNASALATVTFTVDTSAPALAITQPASGAATSDTTPALAGTADASATVALVISDAQSAPVFQTSVTATGGAWSATSSALAEGSYTLRATTTNQAGTTSTAQVSFSVDLSVQLTLSTPIDGALTNDATPTIAGTVEAGAQVIVEVIDAQSAVAFTATLTPDAFGVWTTAPGAALADGDYTLRARATDALGNMASLPDRSFTVDTAPPAVAIVAPAESAIIGAAPSLEGTAEAGASVAITVTDVGGATIVFETVTADMMGGWVASGAALTLAGDYTITAVATDAAGNTAQDQGGFTIDLTAASVAIAQPTNGATVTTSQPTISGTASPDATVLVEILDAQSAVVESASVTLDALGGWSYAVQATLADGAYTARATATRPNATTATATASFTVDTVAPAMVVITAPADDALLNSADVTVSGTAEPGDVVEVEVDGQPSGMATADANGAWTLALTSLADGQRTITASSPTSSAEITITIDTAAPAVAIVAPADGATVEDGRPTFSGTGEQGATVIIEVDGAEVERVTVGPDGMWTWTPADALAVGEHTVEVTARDAAGNTSAPVAVTITVAQPAPELSVAITAPAAGATTNATPTITGTATAGAALSVLIDDAQVGTTVADASGAWSLSLAELGIELTPGTHEVSVNATLGEEQASAGPVSFVVEIMDPIDPNAGVTIGGDGLSCATLAPQRSAPSSLLWLGLVGLVGLLRRRRA